MSVATAAGFRDIGSDTMGYIPEVWAGELLVKFYAATVFGEIANTDYEGDIKAFGDVVHIRVLPDITISNYRKGQTLFYEQPESTEVTLNIDQAKSWSFVGDRIDLAQTDLKNYIDRWTDDAAEQLKIAIDTDILADVYSSAATANQGATAGAISGNINLGVTGTSVSITKVNVLEKIVECGQVLDEQNIPESGRWMVIPAWMAALIKKSDLKDASLAGDGTSIMRNGRIGMIDRFTLFTSNLIDVTSDGGNVYNIIFGTNHAISFASQLVENETLPNPNGFGTLHRGLQVYGFDVIKADALGWLYASQG